MSETTLREAITHAADPVAVMQRVVDQAVALIDGADGSSLEVRREGGVLEYLCTSGTLDPFVGLQVRIDASLSGLCLRSGAVERCDDTETDPRVDRAATRRTGIRSMLCVPLRLDGDAVAVLKVSSAEPDAFDDGDARILERLIEFLGTAMGLSSGLATVTAEVMAGLPEGSDSGALGTARFIANVMSPGLVDDVEARARIETVLVDESLMTMVVQPIVDLLDGSVVGVEALARFCAEPARTPDVWFAEAHRVGLGIELELMAAERALGLLDRLPADVRLAVNVGPAAVVDPRFLQLLAGVPADRVTVEVTEHDEVCDYDGLLAGLDPVRRTCSIAVDDTGNGYAGLSHVLRMRPDVIKVDRALVQDVDTDLARQALVGSLVRLAMATDGVVVAEGVETAEEAAQLVALGVRYGQGWLLGRPVEVDALDLTPRRHASA